MSRRGRSGKGLSGRLLEGCCSSRRLVLPRLRNDTFFLKSTLVSSLTLTKGGHHSKFSFPAYLFFAEADTAAVNKTQSALLERPVVLRRDQVPLDVPGRVPAARVPVGHEDKDLVERLADGVVARAQVQDAHDGDKQ